jgi:hypothetical protein
MRVTLSHSVFNMFLDEVQLQNFGSYSLGTIRIVYSNVEDLDIYFPADMFDLRSDGLTHPYFGHSCRQRWHACFFDDGPQRAFCRMITDTAKVIVNYHVASGQLFLTGSWRVFKKDREDGADTAWEDITPKVHGGGDGVEQAVS